MSRIQIYRDTTPQPITSSGPSKPRPKPSVLSTPCSSSSFSSSSKGAKSSSFAVAVTSATIETPATFTSSLLKTFSIQDKENVDPITGLPLTSLYNKGKEKGGKGNSAGAGKLKAAAAQSGLRVASSASVSALTKSLVTSTTGHSKKTKPLRAALTLKPSTSQLSSSTSSAVGHVNSSPHASKSSSSTKSKSRVLGTSPSLVISHRGTQTKRASAASSRKSRSTRPVAMVVYRDKDDDGGEGGLNDGGAQGRLADAKCKDLTVKPLADVSLAYGADSSASAGVPPVATSTLDPSSAYAFGLAPAPLLTPKIKRVLDNTNFTLMASGGRKRSAPSTDDEDEVDAASVPLPQSSPFVPPSYHAKRQRRQYDFQFNI